MHKCFKKTVHSNCNLGCMAKKPNSPIMWKSEERVGGSMNCPTVTRIISRNIIFRMGEVMEENLALRRIFRGCRTPNDRKQ